MKALSTIKSKLPSIKTSIFSEMSSLANEYDAINLAQGFPDFPIEPKVQELLSKYVGLNKNQYAPPAGVAELRKVLISKYAPQFDWETEINITSGATQALSTIMSASLREGDEVIIFTPAYDSYAPMIELQGAKVIYFQLEHPDYSINWSELQKLLNHKIRMIIINSPHNPSGKCLAHEDYLKLSQLVANSNILILSDEVYSDIVFDGKPKLSILNYPDLTARCFMVGSLGKSLHLTGWKIGFCIAPEDLMKEFRRIHQYQIFSVHTPSQYALAEYLETTEIDVSALYEAKRDFFLDLIKESRFTPIPSEGTYFQLLSYEGISEMEELEMARWLTIEHKVAAIPLSSFYHQKVNNRVLRFCFAKNDSTLEEAALRLNKI